MEDGANPMQFKKLMAYEIVKLIKGEKEAEKAQEYFVKTIQKKELPEEVTPSLPPPIEITVDEFLVVEDMAESKSDARRKIDQGGVSIDGKIIKYPKLIINESFNGKIVKVGKKSFRRITFE